MIKFPVVSFGFFVIMTRSQGDFVDLIKVPWGRFLGGRCNYFGF